MASQLWGPNVVTQRPDQSYSKVDWSAVSFRRYSYQFETLNAFDSGMNVRTESWTQNRQTHLNGHLKPVAIPIVTKLGVQVERARPTL